MVNYRGDYDAYLYSVNKEIDDGEREAGRGTLHSGAGKPPGKAAAKAGSGKSNEAYRGAARPRSGANASCAKRWAMSNGTIARLDEQKRQINGQLLESTDPAEALRLHNEVQSLTAQLAESEDRWCALAVSSRCPSIAGQ